MAGQYSPKQFFRRVPNAMLGTYFSANDIALTCNLPELKENDTEALFAAFCALDATQQSHIEADFQDIDALASDGGIQALIDEAMFHQDAAFTQKIASIEGLHAKAFWAFLEHKEYLQGASHFLHTDKVSAARWHKHNNLPKVPPKLDNKAIEDFENAVRGFFYEKEGRGRKCKAEIYRRYQKEYFFVYPEDYAKTGVEWVQDSLCTQARHPAFEIIFVYCQSEGSLDIYAPKQTNNTRDRHSTIDIAAHDIILVIHPA